jgi:hypothetical protein
MGHEWSSALHPTPERMPGTHWIGNRVGPRAGLDTEAVRKILYPCQGSNCGHPVHSQTLHYTDLPSLSSTRLVIRRKKSFMTHFNITTEQQH